MFASELPKREHGLHRGRAEPDHIPLVLDENVLTPSAPAHTQDLQVLVAYSQVHEGGVGAVSGLGVPSVDPMIGNSTSFWWSYRGQRPVSKKFRSPRLGCCMYCARRGKKMAY
jgi:hypothetical protein